MPVSATNVAFAVTNKADWVQPVQVSDAETEELLDLTGAEINVRMVDQQGCEKFSLTVGDGVEITGTGVFEFTVSGATLSNLCAGTYRIGSIYRLNDEINDLFIGTVQIADNPAQL
jgi:hypothetical protein